MAGGQVHWRKESFAKGARAAIEAPSVFCDKKAFGSGIFTLEVNGRIVNVFITFYLANFLLPL